jgi:hypothetical protein
MSILTFLIVLVLTSFVPIWSTKKNPSTLTSLPGNVLRMARDIALLDMARDALNDLSWCLKSGGAKAYRFREGTNLVLLERDVAEAFPSDESVNEALRLVIQLKKLPRSEKAPASQKSEPK